MIENKWDKKLSVYEQIFVLMPFRHQPNKTRMMNVLKTIDTLESINESSISLVSRFRRATTRRLHGVKEKDKNNENDKEKSTVDDINEKLQNTEIVDKKTENNDHLILERFEMETDEKDLLEQNIVNTMRTFFKE
eukprot:UN23398